MPRHKLNADGTYTPSRTAEARYVDPKTGAVEIVQIQGTKLKPGNTYFAPHIHGEHVFCVDCTAPLRFAGAQTSSGGSSGVGSTAHFIAKRPHDPDCLVPKRAATRDAPTPIDRSKGYILLIETAEFSYSFNKRSGFYEVSEYGRRVRADDSLKDREVITVRGVKDIMNFIRRGERNRIFDTIVVFQNNAIPWRQFCILKDKPERIANLVERAKARSGMQEPPFALVEIETTGPQYHFKKRRASDGKRTFPRAPVDPIKIGEDAHGKPVTVRFDIYRDSENTLVQHAFYVPGTFFVLGEVRHQQYRNEHYLSMTIPHPDQIEPMNIANLAAEAKAAAKKKASKPPSPAGP